jgi:hypothetical protein
MTGNASRSPTVKPCHERSHGLRGANPERARRDSFKAERKQADDIAIQPQGEEQHPGHKLRQDEEHPRIRLRGRIYGGGVGVSGLESQKLGG